MALIRKYPGGARSSTASRRSSAARARPIIGQDSVKWAEIFNASREVGGTEWLTIEQEAYLPNKSPMECAKLSLAGLKKILASL